MPNCILIPKGRTKKVLVSLGYDVSGDTIVSEIREEKKRTSDLIATWNVAFVGDGTDGELVLTLTDSVTGAVEKSIGYMDIKRITGSETLAVFDEVLEVQFTESVTA